MQYDVLLQQDYCTIAEEYYRSVPGKHPLPSKRPYIM